MNRWDFERIIGVGGPGDGFTSSGPHGESSMQAQQTAATHPPSQDDVDVFNAIFGEDAETAEGGGVTQAAETIGPEFEQTAQNIMNDPTIMGGTPVATGPGPAPAGPAPSPVFTPDVVAPVEATHGGGSGGTAIVIGAIAAAMFLFAR